MTILNAASRRHRRRLSATALALLLVAAACGDDDDAASPDTTAGPGETTGSEATTADSSDCVAAADEFLADFDSLPTELPADFTPLAAAPEPGGTIIKIVNGGIPSDAHSADTQEDAAEAIGWTAERVIHDGTVEGVNAAWQEAIAEGPTAITGAGFPVAALQTALDDAEAAGIVAQLSNVTDEAESFPGFAATSNGVPVIELIANIHANLVLRDSNCAAHVAVIGLPFPIIQAGIDEFEAVLAERCPECEVSTTEIQPTDLGSPAATNAIVSALQADPSITYAYTTIGNLAVGLDTALAQAGIDDINIFGQVPDENAIRALQEGTNAWWISQSSSINGWMEVDAILRTIEGEAPVNTTGNPVGILTPENVPTDSTEVPTYPENFEELFRQLWQVED